MTGGGVTGADLQSLKTVLVECNRKSLPPEGPDTRTRVKQLIEEAEARGDARSAKILADSLVKADAAELENEKRKQEAIDATNKYWAEQKAKADAEGDRRREEHIMARAQKLLYAHGNTHDAQRTTAKRVVGTTRKTHRGYLWESTGKSHYFKINALRNLLVYYSHNRSN